MDGSFPARVGGAAPGDRRPAVDVARILALTVVVLGHLTIAVVDLDAAGEVRGTNLLTLEPAWRWMAMLAPMPVFFAAAGWANSMADLRSSARRLAAVVGTAAVVVVVWSSIVAVTWAVGGDETLVGRGAWIATQPLWFLAAYVPLAAMGGHVASLARNHMRPAVVVVVVALVGLDLARFGGDAPAWIGWACFPLAWGLPWLLGAWWRDRVERGHLNERRAGLALIVGGTLVAAGLVAWAGYSVALIDTGGDARSNTTPPGLYTAAAGVVSGGPVARGRQLAGPARAGASSLVGRGGEGRDRGVRVAPDGPVADGRPGRCRPARPRPAHRGLVGHPTAVVGRGPRSHRARWWRRPPPGGPVCAGWAGPDRTHTPVAWPWGWSWRRPGPPSWASTARGTSPWRRPARSRSWPPTGCCGSPGWRNLRSCPEHRRLGTSTSAKPVRDVPVEHQEGRRTSR